MKFEYDEAKNRANIKKHELSFDDAKSTFSDENRIIREDIKHSTDGDALFMHWQSR